jgi:hypothetical protein
MVLEYQEIIFEDFPFATILADSRRWAWRKEFAGYEDHPKPVYVIDPIGTGGWWTKGDPLTGQVTITYTTTETAVQTATVTTTVGGAAQTVTQTETKTETETVGGVGVSTNMAIIYAVVAAIVGAGIGFFLSRQS